MFDSFIFKNKIIATVLTVIGREIKKLNDKIDIVTNDDI